MVIPKLGDLELQLSTISMPNGSLVPAPEVRANIAFYEGPPAGARAPGRLLFPGNARAAQQINIRYANPPVQAGGDSFPADGFGYSGNVFTNGSNRFWPADQQLSSKAYGAQNATDAGSTPVTGFGVHLDQIDYDDDGIDGVVGLANQPITPLAHRIGVRARMTDGGSGAYWWRPWAPLSLVCPTLTPASVYVLPKPITLERGDNLELELEVPGPLNIEGNDISPVYNVGVSLTGYAAIEG
jgi:hypothetical protein